MSLTYDTKEELESRSRRSKARDRGDDSNAEITLGTRSLLGIFFGLVLICGIFFGLGYSVGRVGSARAASAPPAEVPGPTTDGALQKPPAGQQTLTPVTTPDTGSGGLSQDGATTPSPGDTQNTAAAPPPANLAENPATGPGKNGTGPALTPAQTPPPTLTPVSVTQPAPGTPGPGTFMVQVAAVRLQGDADILVSALKKHGYTAVVRNEPQDALLHVQLGPFATRVDAMTMRSRLQADGYNAVLK